MDYLLDFKPYLLLCLQLLCSNRFSHWEYDEASSMARKYKSYAADTLAFCKPTGLVWTLTLSHTVSNVVDSYQYALVNLYQIYWELLLLWY